MGGGGVVLKRGGAVIGRDNYFAFFSNRGLLHFFWRTEVVGKKRQYDKNNIIIPGYSMYHY